MLYIHFVLIMIIYNVYNYDLFMYLSIIFIQKQIKSVFKLRVKNFYESPLFQRFANLGVNAKMIRMGLAVNIQL